MQSQIPGSRSPAGRKCTVCVHKKRAAVDRELIVPGSNAAEIARTYGLNQRAVVRHRQLHLAQLLRTAAQQHSAAEVERGGDLLQEAAAYEDRLLTILTEAEHAQDHRTAIAAIKTCLDFLRFRGEVDGRIKVGSTTLINITTNNAWLSVQAGIVDALAPFPEAKRAVLEVLAAPVN